MFQVIVAFNSDDGIGMNGKIPWHCPGDLSLFKKITENSILIMGRKTVETLPTLDGRVIFCLSKSGKLSSDNNNSEIFPDIDTALKEAKNKYPHKKIFVAGGAEIYNLVFQTKLSQISEVHVSHINNREKCDKFLDFRKKYKEFFKIGDSMLFEDFNYYHYIPANNGEDQYLNLLKEILEDGIVRQGRNGETKSLFGKNMTFDLRKGFPLLTTKKMFFRGIVEELLFFIRGETDSKLLEEKGINIWKGNTNREFLDKNEMKDRKEGMMGPLYGYQWRFFNAKYDNKTGKPLSKGIDQLELVINTIRTDPYSRRIMMTDFNPEQAMDGVLYPCHSIILQFYVSDSNLDMYCYNRSQDVFLGTPFNIASSALFLSFIAKITNLTPRYLQMGLGDVHIYKEHYDQVKEQISRCPYFFPRIVLKKDIKEILDLEALTYTDISLEEYNFHPVIKAEMVA